MIDMERKIGEIFEYQGEWYQCEDWAVNPCSKCDFDGEGICCDELPCTSSQRKDKKYVFFKKLEKVGEPYNKSGIMVQKYKADIPIEMPDEPYMYFRLIDNTVEIEIKQTKEDMEDLDKIKVRDYTKVEELNVMEEKKVKLDKLVTDYTSNKITYNEFEKAVKELYADKEEGKPSLKSFSLEAAKQGKPVCTRDGRKARIICFDLKNEEYPIVAAIGNDSSETLLCYTINGEIVRGNYKSDKDLMMLPEKKEGWVNVYKERIYSTKEEAIEATYDGATYIDTVKVCWEE